MYKRLTKFSVSVSEFFGLGLSLIGSIFLIRLVVDSSFRMVYPFMPQISAGLRLSITAFSWLLSIRSISGLLGPVMGLAADRYGRRMVMVAALVFQGVGMAGVAVSSGWISLLPMMLLGIAINSFLPAQQAYISDQVVYERRGRALASVDIAYSISGIFLLPVVGWILESWGWRVPFLLLSGFSFLSALIVWHFFPKTEIRTQVEKALKSGWWKTFSRPNVLASVGVATLFFVSVGMYMSFWGIWLNEDYGYGPTELGLLATVIGVSELIGAVLSGLYVDRIGKKRTSLMGLLLGGLIFVLVPWVGTTETGIRISLALLGFSMEFAIVSLFPLYGEQAPEARATIFSLVALGNAMGIAIGLPLTTALWSNQGIGGITITAFGFILLSSLLAWKMLRD